MKKIMPDKTFINHLKGMTEENNHGVVYFSVARWCYENCETDTKEGKDHKRVFKMFMDIFTAMNVAHLALGHFPYCSLRYEVGKEMDAEIVECFGEATLDALNEGGR